MKLTLEEQYTLLSIYLKHKEGIEKAYVGEYSNDIIGNLLDYKVITIVENTIEPTNAARRVLETDNKVLKIYPLTPNNDSDGYNNVLLSMSANGKSAFITALTAVASVFFRDRTVSSRAWSGLVESIFDAGIANFLQYQVIESIVNKLLARKSSFEDTNQVAYIVKIPSNIAIYESSKVRLKNYLIAYFVGVKYVFRMPISIGTVIATGVENGVLVTNNNGVIEYKDIANMNLSIEQLLEIYNSKNP